MAAKRKHRAREAQLAFEALSIEGGLLSPEWLSKVAQLQAGTQGAADYRIPKGLNLRDEIGRYWRIAQAHWADFKSGRDAKADDKATAERFVVGLLRDAFAFTTLGPAEAVTLQERSYPIGHAALGGRAPVVIAPADGGLDTLSPGFGDGVRRRSAFGLAQEYLNAQEGALWGIATDGVALRMVRDNASLTRPAWIEADLQRIFTEERYADFAALWLLCHETRFGREGQPVTECALEAWRNAGRDEGTRAREHLRRGVEDALVALGQGFLSHPENTALRAELQSGTLPAKDYFNQLLRLVYRLIFLLTVEERGLLHPEGTTDTTKALYANGYGVRRLRERSVKRSAHDRFSDLWEATKVVCRGLAVGEARLGLPALAGIFAAGQCPALDAAKLENRALLLAVFKLAWLREDGGLSRVNWRDMGPEELGSVYESLLELVPQIAKDGRQFAFATGGETKGNARKTTGSYYTPDSLVQVLLDSALEPVIADTIAKNPGGAIAALLDLSIVDPACGSGHFLLAAARRLAAHVARLQANGTPSAAEYRHALRQVVGRCIFGVDLNPMAVELCKVALWMEAVEPGLPLTFLDSHIQHGNALLGTTPELMAKGIPDAAWEPIEGDDKKIASALKKQNKEDAKAGALNLGAAPVSTYARLGAGARAVDDEDDATLAAVEAKERHWAGLVASAAFEHQRFLADTWCAAFVWRKEPGRLREIAPTEAVFRALQGDRSRATPALREEVQRLRDQYAWFHWPLQFPQVFSKGGFDAVLGNPPWDEVQFEETAWFAAYSSDIASALNAAERTTLINKLEYANPVLFAEYLAARRAVDGTKQFVCSSGAYTVGTSGKLNTATLFTARDATLTNAHCGALGLVVPTGIATDKGASEVFASLMENGRVRSLYDFVNRRLLFPAVRPHQHFCLVTAAGVRPNGVGVAADFAAFLEDPLELKNAERRYRLTWAEVVALNPEARSLPLFTSITQSEASRKLCGNFPPLGAQNATDEWAPKFQQGTFNMASASNLFRDDNDLKADGYRVIGLEAQKPGAPAYVPLFDAKMARQFEWRAASVGFSGNQFRKVSKASSVREQLEDADYVPDFVYWVPKVDADSRFGEWAEEWVLGFKDVTGVTSTRMAAFAFVPRMGVGHKFPLLRVSGGAQAHGVLAAWLNSLLVEWFLRQRMHGVSLTWHILSQVPVPPRATLSRLAPWSATESIAGWVAQRVAELSCTSWRLTSLSAALLGEAKTFVYDEARRYLLRAELDAAMFSLAGFEVGDAVFVMDSLDKVAAREVGDFGEYRSRRVVPEIMAAMTDAARSRGTYQTRLDPPPADPRVAHPPRDRRGVIPLAVKPPTPTGTAVAPAAAPSDRDAASPWKRPRTIERGEIQAAIVAVLKLHGAPIHRQQARLAALLCLEPHLLASMLDKSERAEWSRMVGDDAKRAVTASIEATSQEWGRALSQLRGSEKLVENLQQETWALGIGTETIDTSGWPDGRAGYVLNVLRRLPTTTHVDAIILKLPTSVRQWLANAA